jgi:hypothetical protein
MVKSPGLFKRKTSLGWLKWYSICVPPGNKYYKMAETKDKKYLYFSPFQKINPQN